MAQHGLPSTLNSLHAKDYLHSRDRARGSAPIPDFARIVQTDVENPSSTEITFATMKAALLAIEAALPVGCICTRESGPWRHTFAVQWRLIVVNADGPAVLMQCAILLEDAISEEWVKEDVGHLRSCLPARWKAVTEASPAALAIRIILLDRSIIYGNIDGKRFSSRKKKVGN